ARRARIRRFVRWPNLFVPNQFSVHGRLRDRSLLFSSGDRTSEPGTSEDRRRVWLATDKSVSIAGRVLQRLRGVDGNGSHLERHTSIQTTRVEERRDDADLDGHTVGDDVRRHKRNGLPLQGAATRKRDGDF